MKKIIFILFGILMIFSLSSCEKQNDKSIYPYETIIKEDRVPQKALEWFKSSNNKKSALVYQHPQSTYIWLNSGSKDLSVEIKDFISEDYRKEIIVDFKENESGDKNSFIILKLASDYISSYKVRTIGNEDIPVEDKVIIGLLEEPEKGSKINNPVHVKGKIAVFEGSFVIRIMSDDGKILKEEILQTDGAPKWGAFEDDIEYSESDASEGSIVVGSYSAKDGSFILHEKVDIVFNNTL